MTGPRRHANRLVNVAAWLVVVLAVGGCSPGSPAPSNSVPPSRPTAMGPASADTGPAAARKAVVAENARVGTTAWQLPEAKWATDTELAGWVDHASVLPGDPVTMFTTSTLPSYTVTAYRMGDYAGRGGRVVWKSPSMPGVEQPACPVKALKMVDCSNWKQTQSIATKGWPEGLYLLKLVGSNGRGKYVPLTLRSRDTKGKVVLVNADATYQAYNAYGGYSLYVGPGGFFDRANVVSFNRPYDRSGARHVTAGERQVVTIAERLGLPLAYATNTDIAAAPRSLAGAAGVVSPAHDEYWNTAMRQAYLSARDGGTNLAFMGANAQYWRVRFQAGNRQMVGYKKKELDPVKDDVDTTTLWRNSPKARAENALVGLMYECFPARGALKVTEPDFWMFEGTGAKQGSLYPGVVGVEIDRAYPIPGTPKTLEVAAHSPVGCGDKGMTHSDLAYYTVPSGAGVFASGSMGFAVGIGAVNKGAGITKESSNFVTTVAGNLLTAMAAGPMGKAHPARPNLASLNASPDTSTGSGDNTGADLD